MCNFPAGWEKSGVLEHKSGNISETHRGRGKVTMEGLYELTNALSNVPCSAHTAFPSPRLGGCHLSTNSHRHTATLLMSPIMLPLSQAATSQDICNSKDCNFPALTVNWQHPQRAQQVRNMSFVTRMLLESLVDGIWPLRRVAYVDYLLISSSGHSSVFRPLR